MSARGYLIDPVARTITPVTVGDDEIASRLGCELYDRIALARGLDMWVDDEGRLTYPNPLGYFRIAGELICGRGLVLGHNGAGDTTDAIVNPYLLALHIRWLDEVPDEREAAPSFEVATWYPDGGGE